MAQNNSQMWKKKTLKDLAATHQASDGVITIDHRQTTYPTIAAQLADANALTATQYLIAQIGEIMDAKMLEQNIKQNKKLRKL